MSTDQSTLKSIIALVRDSSLSRLKTLSGRDDISISEVLVKPLVFAHWMSFILISGETLRVIFKVHFMTQAAQFLAARTYQMAEENVSLSRSLDFFKEYCNLTAGQIKIDLSLSSVSVGASLPGIIRGFDEIFYIQQKGSVNENWRLSCGVIELFCSANIEIFDHFLLNKVAADSNSSRGDVEYL